MSWNGLEDFVQRVTDRLDPPKGPGRLEEYGDLDFLTPQDMAAIRAAAVLIGVIPRKSGPTALLTLRPDTMATHAGQVAFPTGARSTRAGNGNSTRCRMAAFAYGA